MLQIALSDLRTLGLQQADLETDAQFATLTLPNGMISTQYGKLYGLVAKAGGRYFEKSSNWVSDGTNYMAEPADILSLVDTVERVLDPVTGRLRRLEQLMPQERAAWAGRSGHARRWELVDRKMYFYPTPAANETYVLRYIPQPPVLTNAADNTQIDVINADGLDFMVWGSAVRMLSKVRSDVTLAVRERDAAAELVEEWAALRAFNEPARVVYDDDEGPWYDGSWKYDR